LWFVNGLIVRIIILIFRLLTDRNIPKKLKWLMLKNTYLFIQKMWLMKVAVDSVKSNTPVCLLCVHRCLHKLLLACLMGQYCFCSLASVVCRLSSFVTLPAGGRADCRPPGAWAVRRPTLHGGPVRLLTVRATHRFHSSNSWAVTWHWYGGRLIGYTRLCRCSLDTSAPPSALWVLNDNVLILDVHHNLYDNY